MNYFNKIITIKYEYKNILANIVYKQKGNTIYYYSEAFVFEVGRVEKGIIPNF